jgi:hypothetical protein
MSTNSSERSKLVPVLCTILQFRADESKIIAERWADKPSGGLVGWLLPKPAPSHIIDRSKKNGGEAMGSSDATYNAATGGSGGVDFYA